MEEFEVDQVSTLIPTDNFSSWLAQPTDPLLLSDLQSDVILPAPLRALRFGSCLVAQLVAQGEVLGVMSCYHQDMHTFSLEEISLLVAVAEQLGISLENYRLRLQAEQVAVSTERRRLAHDLHNSITQSIYSLTLFTRSSQDTLNEGDQEKLITNLEQIEENAVLALKEMRLLLYQMQPQGREGRFAERIEARLDLVERRSGIQATCQINEQISLSPEKQDMLFHIALEALNNSLKHANANRVHISLEKKDGILLMEVADNGHGFDFKDQSDTLNFSGLGLRNMYARADELNGQLDIVSSPNDGTRVCFSIDLRSVQIWELRMIRVLIADDHTVVRKGLTSLLSSEKYGIDVIGEAGDGAQVVDMALELQPDVILMDLQMPRKSGLEAIQEIMGHELASRILVLSSFGEDERVAAAMRAGANGYLLKESSPPMN